jgi:hypothetical protein
MSVPEDSFDIRARRRSAAGRALTTLTAVAPMGIEVHLAK